MNTPTRPVRSRGVLLAASVAVSLASLVGCDARDAKALTTVRSELALLKAPAGMEPVDENVGLGEMYAEGSRTYCAADEKAGQAALDGMLRDAGWKPLSTTTTVEGTSWRYGKGRHLGSLRLETAPQHCGRRFRVDVVEEL